MNHAISIHNATKISIEQSSASFTTRDGETAPFFVTNIHINGTDHTSDDGNFSGISIFSSAPIEIQMEKGE